MTTTFDEPVLDTFLKNQSRLFPEPVAETRDEAEYFLEDCVAVVCDNAAEVQTYLEDTMDITGLSKDEMLDIEEVFKIPDGRYLIVEG